MRLSRDKVMHLSHRIAQKLDGTSFLTPNTDQNSLRMEIANTMLEELSIEDEVNQEVRRILRSYKRPITEGSREWDVMYRKTFEEQMNKRGRIA
jgi:hypothetical protein